jgi:hypothetical protein
MDPTPPPTAFPIKNRELGRLTFEDMQAWRMGMPNQEGWHKDWRYSCLGIAPAWGNFYEIVGEENAMGEHANEWHRYAMGNGAHHFLLSMRDEAFECIASSWRLDTKLEQDDYWKPFERRS